ncbi:hypothetical protein IWQ60_007103 [Tieghemiomyces parasiticus]|uniref:Phospholipid-transporting ATPase n=1 Tax=Tieghemiomyces parasiticus TaxID=78921 RepID=A0A9W7ZZN9_9FUNG|nr:hypothetical protein IWQ60_007103 [Tieghemiomyces parasiticus]
MDSSKLSIPSQSTVAMGDAATHQSTPDLTSCADTATPTPQEPLEGLTMSTSQCPITADAELHRRLLDEAAFRPRAYTDPVRPTKLNGPATPSTEPGRTRLLRNKPSFSQSFRTSTNGSVSLADLSYDLPESYQVDFNHPSDLAKRYKYPTNYQRTTKYTLLTFVPLNLFSQFRRFYNIYFLLAAIFVLVVPSLEPVSEILPLCIVLTITAVKDGIDDYKRYRQDRRINALEYEAVHDGQRVSVLSRDIRPGDVIYLTKGQSVPSDLVLLSTSFEDGTAFVETMDLDGETSLKRRSALRFTQPFASDAKVATLRGRIQCEFPNEKLDQLDGRIHFHRALAVSEKPLDHERPIEVTADPPETSVQPFTTDNVLLRGTHLRNTDFIYGVVVYAGADTKIMLNLKNTGLKFSTMETRLNRLIIAIFVWNAIMLVVSVVLSFAHYTRNDLTERPSAWYLGEVSRSAWEVVSQVMVFFVLYTFLIPISIFVSIELVHVLQALFMRWDPRMVSFRPATKAHKGGKKHMHVHSTSLHEDLGAVEYVFSDKTGTLTKNIMTLSKWGVGCQVFDEALEPGCLGRYMDTLDATYPLYAHYTRFWQAIALCHSAIPVIEPTPVAPTTGCDTSCAATSPEKPSGPLDGLVYEAQSPDEAALLDAIRQNGFVFHKRSKRFVEVYRRPLATDPKPTTNTVQWQGTELQLDRYELLYTFPFSSDRKRMSVVVRTPEGIILLCKGADNVIIPRLCPDKTLPSLLTHTENCIHQFSLSGLRTLVVAARTLDADEFAELQVIMDQAQCALSHREQRLAEVAEWVETDLELLGCTAIEDRLQDQVPETIEFLLRCGIKVWLLTGDKQETAVKIGMSSHLITSQMNMMVLNAANELECADKLEEFSVVAESRAEGEDNALVINGATLGYILDDSALCKAFLRLGVLCHSVICCRVTPLQKARVVELVKKRLHKVTLSIGDGANDVSMIQVAHVGVGIEGMEGAQAVRASDYSFTEFKSLRPLIAIHGRYSYLRIANIIFYSFYKNIVLITVQFWFGFNNAWSGQTLYLDYYLTLFNTVFTCLPPVVAAIFDKDVDEHHLQLYPELFRQVKGNVYWNWRVMVHWGLSALWHSGVIYGALLLVQSSTVVYQNGSGMSYMVQEYFIGTVVFSVVTVKACFLMRHWVWPGVGGVILTVVVYMLIQFGFELFNFVPKGTFAAVHSLPMLYLVSLWASVACMLPDLIVKYWMHTYHPEDAVIIRERCRLHQHPGQTVDVEDGSSVTDEDHSSSQSATLIPHRKSEGDH